MGCYTCKLHQNQDALFNQQRIEVSGEKRDIDALQRFLESDKTPRPMRWKAALAAMLMPHLASPHPKPSKATSLSL